MNKQIFKKKNSFLLQGSILAVAGIFVRIIGLIYRIPLTNIIGDAGMGVYSTAFSIYNILLLISSYSMPLALSRLISVRLAARSYKNVRKVFIGALIFAFVSGAVFGSICYFGADFFAGIMHMPQASYAITSLAPTIFIMAFLGVLRGYFQGHSSMIPTAISQIAEQIVNAAVSILAGYLLFKSGAELDAAISGGSDYYSSAYGAAGGTIGTGSGALAALIFCIIIYFGYRPTAEKLRHKDMTGSSESYGHILKILALTIFPILFSTTIYQISTIVDQGIFAQYVGTDYKAIWGAYTSKYTTIMHIPTAIASSLGSAIIPALAAANERSDIAEMKDKTALAIRFNMLIAIPASVGLGVLAGPITDLLFSTDNTYAITMMYIGSSAVLFTALSTTSNALLQGIGNIWIPARNSLISLLLHCGVLAVLLWGFDIGIYGVVIANIFFYIFMSILNNLSLRRILGYKQEFRKTFLLPLLCSAIMGLVCFALYKLIFSLTVSNLFSVIVSIIIGIIVFLEALIITKCVDEDELCRMPKGKWIIYVCKKLRLMR